MVEPQLENKVPKSYIIILYNDANVDTHIQALEAVTSMEYARASNDLADDSKVPGLSCVLAETEPFMGPTVYSGISQAVIRWIKARRM
jgi:hypothetical protein